MTNLLGHILSPTVFCLTLEQRVIYFVWQNEVRLKKKNSKKITYRYHVHYTVHISRQSECLFIVLGLGNFVLLIFDDRILFRASEFSWVKFRWTETQVNFPNTHIRRITRSFPLIPSVLLSLTQSLSNFINKMSE